VQEFQQFCARNDWQPAFYQVLPDYLAEYRQAGFDALCIGQEAIVDLKAFTLEGKLGKPLRVPYNHITRLGYQARLHEPPLPDALLVELRSISDEWLTLMHGTEKRFSLGWFDDEYMRGCPVMAVHAADGSIAAFANLISEYQANEATIDLMRHRRDPENGTMDFLFVALLQWAQSQGFDTFNLGLSGLAGVGEQPGDPAVERVLHYIYEHVNEFYNFKGLHAFKEKFHPIWSPRYLIYPGPASLLPVALALLQADSGEGLVSSQVKRLITRQSVKMQQRHLRKRYATQIQRVNAISSTTCPAAFRATHSQNGRRSRISNPCTMKIGNRLRV
jgi:phosphatidylglycerol lysyltransferase